MPASPAMLPPKSYRVNLVEDDRGQAVLVAVRQAPDSAFFCTVSLAGQTLKGAGVHAINP